MMILENIYFNSIKVQLEQPILISILCKLIFQFHKGTIRTIISLLFCLVLSNFNSIKVQLELASKEQEYEYLGNFNSIKVQLELFCG